MASRQYTRKDLSGNTYGRWTVLDIHHRDAKHAYYSCRCECGTVKVVRGGSLTTNKPPTRSCGCLAKEWTIKNKTVHGRYRTPENITWMAMIQRCENPKHVGYKYYGARGVVICKRWRESFEAFFEDMGTKPTPKHSLDRKNPNGNYEKDNCRWATNLQQGENMRSNRLLTFNGKTQCVSAWAREVGINNGTVSRRLQRGWSVERTLTQPVNH